MQKKHTAQRIQIYKNIGQKPCYLRKIVNLVYLLKKLIIKNVCRQ